MSNDIVEKDLNVSRESIVNYFNPPGSKAGMIFFLLLVSLGLYFWEPIAGVVGAVITILIIVKISKKGQVATDEQIDAQWDQIAQQREDEAYRVAHIDKEDVIRDAEYFWAWPQEFQKGEGAIDFKEKEGLDENWRKNYQRLVYMIYAKDQLVVFDENICIENNWDGLDNVQEYYWSDVSSVGFDQKTNTLEIACGPRIIAFPLKGEKKEGEEDNSIVSTEAAENLSNSVRVILRERKAS